jgi:hypothetical protein
MKTRRLTVIAILVAVLGTATVFMIGFHETLYGLAAQRFFKWEEESFKGRPLSELQSNLTREGRELQPVDSDSFYALTDKSLKANQRAMRFTKGKEYRWFRYGTAINVGYVVAEKEGEFEKVIAIIRARSVDSL